MTLVKLAIRAIPVLRISPMKETAQFLFQDRYVGKGAFDLDEATNARDITGVDDWWVFNSTVGVKVNKEFARKMLVVHAGDRISDSIFHSLSNLCDAVTAVQVPNRR